MGLFNKNKNDLLEGHNNDLFSDEDDVVLFNKQTNTQPGRISGNRSLAPHALTASEVSRSMSSEDIPMTGSHHANSVYERMMEREKQTVEQAIGDDYVPSWATKTQTPPAVQEEKVVAETVAETIPVTSAQEVKPAHDAAADAFLERCRMAVEQASGKSTATPTEKPATDATAVYTSTTSETAAEKQPAQRSVDDIVRMLRGNSHDGRNDDKPTSVLSENTPDKSEQAQPTVAVKPDNSQETTTEKKVNVEVISTDTPSEVIHTTGGRIAIDSDVKIYGKVVNGKIVGQKSGDNVEIADVIDDYKTAVEEARTIVLSDLGDAISKQADADMESIKKTSYEERFYDDEDSYEDLPYYETQDEELDGIDDYKNLNDAARLRTELMGKKAKQLTVSVFSIIATLITLAITGFWGSMLTAKTVSGIELIMLAASLIVNFKIFEDFKNLAKFKPKFDSCVAVAASVTVLQSAISTFFYNGSASGCSCLALLLLTVNAITAYLKTSRILKGLEKHANSNTKRAVTAYTGAKATIISSGAVSGEVLALADRRTHNITGYLKNSNYKSPLDLKIRPLFITGCVLALCFGLLFGLLSNFLAGITVAAVTLCCVFPASTALTCELPMFFIAKRLAKYDAALAGFKGAYELNLSNVIAINSTDLFPEGSVTLYNMKALGENEVTRSIVDAAAVAIAANSPLKHVFKQILDGNSVKTLPTVNGVQYEDKMGISGWIGEKTILIGNRNLMQGHNIPVPAPTVDQKILRAGYFPVYIACDGVPCLLFMVKYDVDPTVAHELHKLCNTGMTIVVNPTDPNTSETMICDYFGLPNDALKVMNHNGRTLYAREATPIESIEAPASFGKTVCGFFSAVSSSIRLRSIYIILATLFIINAGVGTVALLYLAVAGKLTLSASIGLTVFNLLFAAVSAIIAKVKS